MRVVRRSADGSMSGFDQSASLELMQSVPRFVGGLTQPEQVVNLLRQTEVAIANGKTASRRVRKPGSWTYFRGRKEYGRLQVDQAKRLKELEQENPKRKRLVANLSLDNLVLKDFASGNF